MSQLSSNHQRAIVSGFIDIHRRLEQMEALLAAEKSAFSENVIDLSPTEAKVVKDYFSRIRSTMLACLQENDIPLQLHRISLRWNLQTCLTFLGIVLEELRPERLRGYGFISPNGRDALTKILNELEQLVDRVSAYLRQGLGQDLSQRLARLEASPGTVDTLTLLNQIVMRWQLVEFRPLIDNVLQRLAHPQYEIAVFGRVNSGKSSLLNHVVGENVLPVGVTPITAVPTRLVRGERAFAQIQFAERDETQIPLDKLAEYASEDGNPANRKRVTGITVHVPSQRLNEGVVLVDTPGIGSLALAGGAETLAYLPRCDLGVLLIDAATTLNQDDLAVLRALCEAGIPAHVLVSKADLLGPADQNRTRFYVRQQIERELKLNINVNLVSTVGAHEKLLTQWFEQDIAPLFERHRMLAEQSLQRKIASVRESVVAVLQTIASKRGTAGDAKRSNANLQVAGRLLDQADNSIQRTKERCRDWNLEGNALADAILRDAAKGLLNSPSASEQENSDIVTSMTQYVLVHRTQAARQVVDELQHTLKRTLESIQQSGAFNGIDTTAFKEFMSGGLPILELSGLGEKCRIIAPWWRMKVSRWSLSILRSWLEKQLGPAIHEFVEGYNNQLGIWLKEKVTRLAETYQSQAEILRQQARRISAKGAATGGAEDSEGLMRDIQELQKDGKKQA